MQRQGTGAARNAHDRFAAQQEAAQRSELKPDGDLQPTNGQGVSDTRGVPQVSRHLLLASANPLKQSFEIDAEWFVQSWRRDPV